MALAVGCPLWLARTAPHHPTHPNQPTAQKRSSKKKGHKNEPAGSRYGHPHPAPPLTTTITCPLALRLTCGPPRPTPPRGSATSACDHVAGRPSVPARQKQLLPLTARAADEVGRDDASTGPSPGPARPTHQVRFTSHPGAASVTVGPGLPDRFFPPKSITIKLIRLGFSHLFLGGRNKMIDQLPPSPRPWPWPRPLRLAVRDDHSEKKTTRRGRQPAPINTHLQLRPRLDSSRFFLPSFGAGSESTATSPASATRISSSSSSALPTKKQRKEDCQPAPAFPPPCRVPSRRRYKGPRREPFRVPCPPLAFFAWIHPVRSGFPLPSDRPDRKSVV